MGDSAALKEAWGRVGELPGGDVPGEWVPWMAVWIKDGVSPRAINSETVDRYAENFAAIMSTAPIRVQRGTFALIDGRHRLEAAPKASSDFVRIVEVDVSDDDLPLMAFRANVGHGLPYTLSERVAGAKLLLRAYPDMRATELAQETGLSYTSAKRYKLQIQGLNTSPKTPEKEWLFEPSVGVGVDNNTSRPAPITRVPEPVDEWDEPARDEWADPATEDDDWPVEEPAEIGLNTSPKTPENEWPKQPSVGVGVDNNAPGVQPDPWLSHRKEGPWLDDLIRLAERYPFESVGELVKAISDHPEPKRCRHALGVLGLLYDDLGVTP